MCLVIFFYWFGENDDINMNYRSNSEGKPFERTHTERSTHDDAAGTATTATKKE